MRKITTSLLNECFSLQRVSFDSRVRIFDKVPSKKFCFKIETDISTCQQKDREKKRKEDNLCNFYFILVKAIQSSPTPGLTRTSNSKLSTSGRPHPSTWGRLGQGWRREAQADVGSPPQADWARFRFRFSCWGKIQNLSFSLVLLTWTGSLLLTWVIMGRLRITG